LRSCRPHPTRRTRRRAHPQHRRRVRRRHDRYRRCATRSKPMNPEENAVSESHFAPQAPAPAVLSATRPLYWSVRREIWENRSIYLAPLAVAVAFLLVFVVGLIVQRHLTIEQSPLSPMKQHVLLQTPYLGVSVLLMLTTFLIAVFYCLD